MADGSTKPIEKVKPGDEVLADDPEDDENPKAYEVIAVPKNWTKRLIHIDIDEDGDSKADAHYRVTGKHPIWTTERGWQDAVDLKAGDRLLTEKLKKVRVIGVFEEQIEVDTYNLTVAGVHTFYVVDAGVAVLVHNTDVPLPSFDAREAAFEFAGMTNSDEITFSKVDPATGTVVEFKGADGAKVGYDGPHDSPGPYHDQQHISAQTGGKRSSGEGKRQNFPYGGEQHPSRSKEKPPACP